MYREKAQFIVWRVALGILVCVMMLPLGRPRPVGAQGYRYVDNDVVRQCGGNTPCYTSIQDAVDAASDGDTVYVYPGDYYESVDLSMMDPDGAISLTTVDASGSPAPGTVSIWSGGANRAFWTSSPFDGDVTIVGFNKPPVYYGYGVRLEVEAPGSATRDVVLRHMSVETVQGVPIDVTADGNVTIADCTVGGGTAYGIYVRSAGGNVEITRCTATYNGFDGIGVFNVQGDVTISSSYAYVNDIAGIHLDGISGKSTISQYTAHANSAGVWVTHTTSEVEITGCILRDNFWVGGIWVDGSPGPTLDVHGSIICGNQYHGVQIHPRFAATVDAKGNWWGCSAGPEHARCDSIDGGAGLVYFAPWIDTISVREGVGPVVVGEPTVIGLQFSDSTGSVFLGPGPGDPRDPAPFTVSTDNGILNGEGSTVGGFIEGSNGVLEVTLVPERIGPATLTVVGPCGLEGTVVIAVEEEFVPEPGTLLLLGSGLMGLAGYAGLRLKKR